MVHYENVKTDVLTEMRKILNFFNMPISEERLKCLFKHKDGLFHREPTKTPEVVPFNPEIRKGIYVSFALIPQIALSCAHCYFTRLNPTKRALSSFAFQRC